MRPSTLFSDQFMLVKHEPPHQARPRARHHLLAIFVRALDVDACFVRPIVLKSNYARRRFIHLDLRAGRHRDGDNRGLLPLRWTLITRAAAAAAAPTTTVPARIALVDQHPR